MPAFKRITVSKRLISKMGDKLQCRTCKKDLRQVGLEIYRHFTANCKYRKFIYTHYYCIHCYDALWIDV